MTLYLVCLSLFATYSCNKVGDVPKNSNMLYLKTELGGCNVKNSRGESEDSDIKNDTVIITVSENSVNVFVGLTYTCKVEPFETQVEIIDDVLYLYIKDICHDDDGNEVDCGYERCHCYYTFDFVFNYEGELNQKYKILLYKNIRADWEEPISIFSESIINIPKR